MVVVPPLPTAIPHSVAEEVNTRPAHAVRLGEVFEGLDLFNADQIAEVYVWLAEHPMPGMNPIRLAIGAVNSLNEKELLQFMELLKDSMDEDMWELLTGD